MGKFHKHENKITLALFVLLAVCIAWLGGMTRTYNAFGGEDVAALCLIGWAIKDYIDAEEEQKNE